MTIRRQKNIADTLNALDRAMDLREVLLAKLARNEKRIATLRKRSSRAQKAFVGKGDLSTEIAGAPRPYRYDPVDADGEMNDDIPAL